MSMKTLEEIIASEPVYAGRFSSRESVEEAYRETFSDSVHIKFAGYHTPPYEGNSLVIYEEGGKLYCVIAGHCSCYGLEERWGGALVQNPSQLAEYVTDWSYAEGFREELAQFLGLV